MHILAFEHIPSRFAGGQERSLFEVCQSLSRHGVHLSLSYSRPGDLLVEYEQFCRSCITRQHSQLHMATLARTALDLMFHVRSHWSDPWDLLYSNQYSDLPFATVLAILLRRKVICHLRLAAPEYLSRQYRFGLERAAKLIVPTQWVADSYIAYGISAEKFVVVPNGSDPERFAPNCVVPAQRPEAPLILFVGRVTPDKGVDVLIDAFVHVRQAHPGVRLRIVGGGETSIIGSENYQREVKRKALSCAADDVEFVAHVEDVRPQIAAADLLVLPTPAGESFGRVLTEAMLMEVPVVAARSGGVPEVLGSEFSEFMATPGDASALASVISRWINWRSTDPTLGARFRAYATNAFPLERTLNAVRHVLTEQE